MKVILTFFVLFTLPAFAEVDKIAQALDARANEDCKFLEETNQKYKSKNPDFFKNGMIYKTCYINLRVMLDKCIVDSAKTIASRTKPSDSLETKQKVVNQEAGVQKACVVRALEITKDEVTVAAQDKVKSDEYIKRSLELLNKSKSK